MAEGGPADAEARLRLARSDQIGPATYRHLIARFGSASLALERIPDLAARGGGRAPRLASVESIRREIDRADRLGARYLFLGEPGYPHLLSQIDSAPPVLVVIGDIGLLDRTCVAMVGARNASAAACRFARMLAGDLGRAGAVIVSGLARGVDTAAHDGSIDHGTVAVVAGGADIFYPPENEARQRGIGERGLLIAEQPPGVEPKARHFPYRNRIIAGLSLGTLVIEAAPRSGSLITARHAGEYGREVMAVPGSPLDPRAQGCNLLIRDGATLIQSAEDVIEAIRPLDGRMGAAPRMRETVAAAPAPEPELDGGSRSAFIDLLSATPVAVDELIRQSQLDPSAVAGLLLELELAGRLARHAGGRVSVN